MAAVDQTIHSHTRAQLLAGKRDILSAIRRLEQDRAEGTIDPGAYELARQRYELEAASILERLDGLPSEEGPPVSVSSSVAAVGTPPVPRRLTIDVPISWLLSGGAVLLIAAAMALLLFTSTHPRSGSESITGSAGQSVATPSPQVVAAQQAVQQHPRSVDALLRLGTAYLDTGDAVQADRTFRSAMTIAPGRPEAATLHAMLIGSAGQEHQALVLLRRVERAHPSYAKAWLLDGLLSSHQRSTLPGAITAWQRFLALQPHASVANQVRQWIAATRKQLGRKKS